MLPGIVGCLQANEALKLIVGYGQPLNGRLLTFDAQSTSFAEVKVRRDPACPVCGGTAEASSADNDPSSSYSAEAARAS